MGGYLAVLPQVAGALGACFWCRDLVWFVLRWCAGQSAGRAPRPITTLFAVEEIEVARRAMMTGFSIVREWPLPTWPTWLTPQA